MSVPVSHLEEQQCRALAFALDRVFARAAAAAPTRENLERTVTALRAENVALRREIRELERALYPDDADIEAFAREIDTRLAGERERDAEERI
jgi:predicted RNase H-like nuclease (RuvC/YqgF family)